MGAEDEQIDLIHASSYQRGCPRGHPERDYVWHQYVDAAFDDVTACTAVLQRAAPADRRRLAAWATKTLDDLQTLQTRWSEGRHAGALLPAPNQVQAQRALIAAAR
jgi:hypothetical protein